MSTPSQKSFQYTHTASSGAITIACANDDDELGAVLSREFKRLGKVEPDWSKSSYRDESNHSTVFLYTKVATFCGHHIMRIATTNSSNKQYKQPAKGEQKTNNKADIDMTPADEANDSDHDSTFEEACDDPHAAQAEASSPASTTTTSSTTTSSTAGPGPAPAPAPAPGPASAAPAVPATGPTPAAAFGAAQAAPFTMSNNNFNMTHAAFGHGNFNNSHNHNAANAFTSTISRTGTPQFDRTTGMADITPQQQQVYATLSRQSIHETKTSSAKEMKGHLNELAVSAGTSIDISDLEAVLGARSTSIPIRYLSSMQRASEAVAVIIDDEGEEIATGFMISPCLLMTNHHVIQNPKMAKSHVVRFQFIAKKNVDPNTDYELDPKTAFITSEILDFTIVAVKDFTAPVFHPLTSSSAPSLTDERLFIIGHPAGRPMEVSLQGYATEIIAKTYLRYTNDTEGGSSGSPVLNRFWKLVALHHMGVPARDANGNVLCKDGVTIWNKNTMSRDKKKYVANQGILIGVIYDTVLQFVLKKLQTNIDDPTVKLIVNMLMQDPDFKPMIQKQIEKMKKQQQKQQQQAAKKQKTTQVKQEEEPAPPS